MRLSTYQALLTARDNAPVKGVSLGPLNTGCVAYSISATDIFIVQGAVGGSVKIPEKRNGVYSLEISLPIHEAARIVSRL